MPSASRPPMKSDRDRQLSPPDRFMAFAMLSLVLLAAGGTFSLPGYALGQSLADARNVAPIGKSRATWHLRCTGDEQVPDGLEVSSAEKSAGVRRCWTTERIDGVEQRTAFPRRNADRATQEIEFLDDRIVRIRRTYFFAKSDRTEEIITWSTDDAAKIDQLGAADFPSYEPKPKPRCTDHDPCV